MGEQFITDVANQLKHNFPPACIPHVSPVYLGQSHPHGCRPLLPQKLFTPSTSRGYFPAAYWLEYAPLLNSCVDKIGGRSKAR